MVPLIRRESIQRCSSCTYSVLGDQHLCCAALIQSFDSSGPIQMARYGWAKLAPRYTSEYGLSAEKLQVSREARLAFWLIEYRARVGLPWRRVDEHDLLDDPTPPPWVQRSLDTLLAS